VAERTKHLNVTDNTKHCNDAIDSANKSQKLAPEITSNANSLVIDSYVSKFCLESHHWGRRIHVYQCLTHPEEVSHRLALWEKRHGIEEVQDNGPLRADRYIPEDAVFLVVADDFIWEPFGAAIFFGISVPNGTYELKFGFYYSFQDKQDNNLFSLTEWADIEACGSGIITKYECIGKESCQLRRFMDLYVRMAKAVDAEMDFRSTRRKFRNIFRQWGWRRRGPVLKQ
jgi:hypothetical protein